MQAALSARLDGEPTGLDDEVIDAHLAHCAECRDFYERAAQLNRQLNFCVVEPHTMAPPDLAEIILAEVEPTWRRRANARVLWSALARIALVVLALLYTVWGLNLLGETASISAQEDPLSARLLAEAATFRLGIAVGLLFAAWRPGLITGMLPVFGALWTFSLGFAVRDMVIGVADSTTVFSILLLLITSVVLTVALLNQVGTAALRRTWSSLNARPA